MNTTAHLFAAAALALAAVGPVAAQEAESDAWMNIRSTQSRAEVQAALAQARADGSLQVLRLGYLPTVAPVRSRAEVRAAVLEARVSGELACIDAEVYAFCDDGFDRQSTGVAIAAR